MHPVLIYTILFIIFTTSLLFLFEKYQFKSIYILLIISSVITWLVGKLFIKLFPSEDPMQQEIEKDNLKVRANQYRYEIQYIFNIVQPDPKLQPSPKRMVDSLSECFDLDENIIRKRLQQYFGDTFDIETSQSLPDMIEEIKTQYQDWPR